MPGRVDFRDVEDTAGRGGDVVDGGLERCDENAGCVGFRALLREEHEYILEVCPRAWVCVGEEAGVLSRRGGEDMNVEGARPRKVG